MDTDKHPYLVDLVDMNDPDDVGRFNLYKAYIAHCMGEMTSSEFNALAAKTEAERLARRYSGANGKLVWLQDKAAEVAAWIPKGSIYMIHVGAFVGAMLGVVMVRGCQ